MQGNLLKLNSVKVADLLGAQARPQGHGQRFRHAPRFDLTFNATVPDTDKLLAYRAAAELHQRQDRRRVGERRRRGTLDALTLRDVAVTMLGVDGHATGALKIGDAFSFDFPNFALQSADASRLVAVASRPHA